MNVFVLMITHRVNNDGAPITELTLDPTKFHEEAFKRCLSFLYTGVLELTKDSEHLEETIKAARMFNLPELQMVCENASKEEEYLNPSIGTWLNDRNASLAKQMFLNKV